VVFNDATLIDLIARWPTTISELLEVSGIGPTKADRHGTAILDILAAHERPDQATGPVAATTESFDPDAADGSGGPVHGALRAWRAEVSRAAGIPAYRVFNNRTLDALVELRPGDLVELLDVPGIGRKTLDAYGEAILAAMADAG
jgi:superfamily II DNA helicase RecQ